MLSAKNVYNFENVYTFEIFKNCIFWELFDNYEYVPPGVICNNTYTILYGKINDVRV